MKKPVGVLSAEQINFDDIKNWGEISRSGKIGSDKARKEGKPNESIIAINPGGEETWQRLVSAYGQPNCPFVVMNNSYSTSYDLGNRKGFEEVYYLKRISRGFVFESLLTFCGCIFSCLSHLYISNPKSSPFSVFKQNRGPSRQLGSIT